MKGSPRTPDQRTSWHLGKDSAYLGAGILRLTLDSRSLELHVGSQLGLLTLLFRKNVTTYSGCLCSSDACPENLCTTNFISIPVVI